MPRYIRELRMGRPKTFKTGAVVRTYPKPMLVFEGDKSGLDIIVPPQKVEWTDFNGLAAYCGKKREELPEILALDFLASVPTQLDELYEVSKDSVSFPNFNRAALNLLKGCPWRTVVIDPLNRLTEIILGHLATSSQAGQLTDPRKWANSVGQRILKHCAWFQALKCHFVCILHTSLPDKDETTSQVNEEPLIPGRNARAAIPGLFGSVFYASIENGKAVITTQSNALVSGIGATWPTGLPAKVGADFQSIYGAAVKAGELEI